MSRFLRFTKDGLNPDDVRMTLGEHLEELRTRVIRALVALAVGAVLCYIFIDPIMGFLTSPVFAVYRQHGIEPAMLALNPAEPFMTDLKVAIIVGFILSAPYSLWQIWAFIAAGLYMHERKWVYRFAPTSIALFFAGAFFLLFVVSPLLLDFLLSYRQTLPNYQTTSWLLGKIPSIKENQPQATWPTTQPMMSVEKDPAEPPEGVPWINLQDRDLRIHYGDKTYTIGHLMETSNQNRLNPMMRLSEYIIFILQLAAAFGLSFQVPVAGAFVATLGIASAAQMAGLRRYIWFTMAIAAAVVTPTTDVTSLCLLLVPMMGLLEIGLLAARLIERGRKDQPAAG